MTVANIIKQVRWSLDEESGSTDFVDTYLDNIIKAKVYDALRWVNLYADASLLNDAASAKEGGSVKYETAATITDGYYKLEDNFVRLIRIKANSWHKAVMTLIEEDSDEYAMQSDENYSDVSKATVDRPVVALIRTIPNKLQLFPWTEGDTAEITYVMLPSGEADGTVADETEIHVPSKLITAYIYYLCYLVMIAYNDTTKAANMLATAKMNVAASDNNG